MNRQYATSAFLGVRRKTRVVRVGEVEVGGDNPVRIQSMTTTDTRDTESTAAQIESLANAGCEIARVTVPSIRDAESLPDLRADLKRRGVKIPLVADIHFTPNAAMVAALHVEKVRINPGNYADKKKFEVRDYSDAEYRAELERVAERFRPLVQRCRDEGVAMRIGTNHGSLSDRIMNRFGDTPLGMVESALEFLQVCEEEGYREIVFSMKASNTQVAIQAYRLLAMHLAERAEGASYPFHLGVTEAGESEDGRIKSAIGIGSLLEDGLGDTIRVSLTEHPVREIPVAYTLARRADRHWAEDRGSEAPGLPADAPFVHDPYSHVRRESTATDFGGLEIGGEHPVRVELDLGSLPAEGPDVFGEALDALAALREVRCESLMVGVEDSVAAAGIEALREAMTRRGLGIPLAVRIEAGLLASLGVGLEASRLVVPVSPADSSADLERAAATAQRKGQGLEWCLQASSTAVVGTLDRILALPQPKQSGGLVLSVESPRPTHSVRAAVARLRETGHSAVPIALRHRRDPGCTDEEALLEAALDLGPLLCDGIGDLVSLTGFPEPARAVDLAYRILQGARLRTTRTEFISCPSCGRTLFDLEETTARIKERTQHLKGVKIAIMGCIVNGPGEMADADFGYVGSGVGQVTLYAGKDVIARAVPSGEATDRLVEIIRESGRWIDPA